MEGTTAGPQRGPSITIGDRIFLVDVVDVASAFQLCSARSQVDNLIEIHSRHKTELEYQTNRETDTVHSTESIGRMG